MIPQLLTTDWEHVRNHLERLHGNPPGDHLENENPLTLIDTLMLQQWQNLATSYLAHQPQRCRPGQSFTMNKQELNQLQRLWQNLNIQKNLNDLDATKVSKKLNQLYQQTFQKTSPYSRIAVCLENNSRRQFFDIIARIFSDSIRQQLQAREADTEESYPREKDSFSITSHVLPQTGVVDQKQTTEPHSQGKLKRKMPRNKGRRPRNDTCHCSSVFPYALTVAAITGGVICLSNSNYKLPETQISGGDLFELINSLSELLRTINVSNT